MTIHHGTRTSTLLLLLLASLFLISCMGSSGIQTMIHEGPQSHVYLQWVPSESFRASHPTVLPSTIIRNSLRGVTFQRPAGFMEGFVGRESKPLFVFSENDVELLTPHLVSALSQATPEEHVVFERTYSPYSKSKTLVAILYIQKNLLFLTFTKFGYKKTGPGITFFKGNRSIPNHFSLRDLEFSFTPETAWRQDLGTNKKIFDEFPAKTLVLDYTVLAGLSTDQDNSRDSSDSTGPLAETPSHHDRKDIDNVRTERGSPAKDSTGRRQNQQSSNEVELHKLEEEMKFLRQGLSAVEDKIKKLRQNP